MAGTTIASLRILLGLDNAGVKPGTVAINRDLQTVQRQALATNTALSQVGAGLRAGIGLGAGFGAFQIAATGVREFTQAAGDAINNARDLTETINKSAVVFGPAAAEVAAFGESAARDLGLSQNAAIGAAATFGNLFTALKIAPQSVAPMSKALVQLASDIASFNNTSIDEALTRLQSGIVGETEAVRRFGIDLSETAVKTELLRTGVEKMGAEFTQAQKVQARYNLIFAQTGTAQGDFARTSGDLANQQRILDAQLTNVSANIGKVLIPAMTGLARVLNDDVLPALDNLANHDLPDFIDNSKREIGDLEAALRFVASPLGNLADLWRSNAEAIGATGRAYRETTPEVVAHAIAIVEANRLTDEQTGALKDVTSALLGAGKGTDYVSDQLLNMANAARIANRDLTNLNTSLGTVNIMGENLLPGGMSLGESFLEDLAQDQRNRDAALDRERERLAKLKQLQADAAANAKRNAAETASAYRDRLGDAFDAVRAAAHKFFDELHQRNLDAIRDAQRMADEQIAAQKRANLEAVTAAEAAFDAVQKQRQLASLQASVASAEDPTQKIAAQQSLNDFLTRQRIDAMRGIATAANDQLDAQKAANDKLAADAIAAENDRAAAQVQAFDFGLAALQKSLSEQPKAWSTTQQQVMKLLMSFGVDYQKAGQSLGEQYAAGLLSTTRLAEDAAKALALSAGSPLGVAPGAAGGTGGTGGAAPAVAGITPVEFVIHNHIYLEGDQIMDFVDRHQASTASRVTSGGIAG